MPRIRYGGHLLGRRNGAAIEHYQAAGTTPPPDPDPESSELGTAPLGTAPLGGN